MALVADGPGLRDPIFHAQLEKEIAIVKKEFAGDPKELDKYITATENTCLLCHGVMGKRQYDIDQYKGNEWVGASAIRYGTHLSG